MADEGTTKPRLDPGMRVEVTARRLQQQISAAMTEQDLGMQVLLEQAIEEFINGGGLARQVKETVDRELPRIVTQIVFQQMYAMREDMDLAIAEVLRKQFARGAEGG